MNVDKLPENQRDAYKKAASLALQRKQRSRWAASMTDRECRWSGLNEGNAELTKALDNAIEELEKTGFDTGQVDWYV